MQKFYQACFTRLGTNAVDSGWQLLNLSPDLTVQAKKLFENSEKGNQNIGVDTPRDVNGAPLNMLEVICGDTCAGIVRVQYGTESVGRGGNMFCHGYLFENAYELLKEPGQLIRVSDSNFHFTSEETKVPTVELSMDPPYTVEDALAFCGMDREHYLTYIYAVYTTLSTSTAINIYVQTDGSDKMARELYYLTCCAIPYSLRMRVTMCTNSSLPNPGSALIFSHQVPVGKKYINPVTGDNNILNKGIIARFNRNPYVGWFVEHYTDEAGMRDYFDHLESQLEEMGDRKLCSMDALRLAHTMVCKDGNTSPAVLLYDWLNLPVPNNLAIERNIYRLLKQIIAKNIVLSDEAEQMLQSRLEQVESPELRELGLKYQTTLLLRMDSNAACAYLNQLSSGSEQFKSIRMNLAQSQIGRKHLADYYTAKGNAILQNMGCSCTDLVTFWSTCSDLNQDGALSSLQQIFASKAYMLFVQKIKSGAPWNATIECVYKTLQELGFPGNTPVCLRYAEKLLYVFDESFLTNFSESRMMEYRGFYSFYERLFPVSAAMLRVMDAMQQMEYETVWRLTQKVQFTKQQSALMFRYGLGHHMAEQCCNMHIWLYFAQKIEKNVIEVMAECKAALITDLDVLNDELDQCYEHRTGFWSAEHTDYVLTAFEDYLVHDPQSKYRSSFTELQTYRKQLRADEKAQLKQQRQEEKRAQKQQRQEEKRAQKRKSQEPVQYEEYSENWDITDSAFESQNQLYMNEASNSRDWNYTNDTDPLDYSDDEPGQERPESEEKSSNGLLSKLGGLFGGKRK